MSRGEQSSNVKEFARKTKILFMTLFSLLLFGTFSFSLITKDSLIDSFYRVLNTFIFVFNENTNILEKVIEYFYAVVGVFILWWALWSIFDMLINGNLTKYLKYNYYKNKITKMENHIIIVGGGRVGSEIAKRISQKSNNFLIIETDKTIISRLKKTNYTIIEGDVNNENILKSAMISKASKIVFTMPDTKSNIILTLTVKELNPKIEIISRCEKLNLVSKLKKAGASKVIVPEIVAADKISDDLGF